MLKKLLIFILFPVMALSQDDLLNEIDKVEEDKSVSSAFKSLKIVNIESTKLVAKGDFWLVISHRFGYINNGIEDFFGLDFANTRIQGVYGISNKFNVQISRDKFNKAYEGALKYTIFSQKKDGFPFEISGFNSIALNTALDKSNLPKIAFNDRIAYVNQLLISKKFNDGLSLQIAPTYSHENFVEDNNQKNSQISLGIGGRAKLTKRVSVNFDYVANFSRAESSGFKDPIGIGFDIETGGHVFQLFFTNARASHENGYISNTLGNFFKGDISFGFNLVRVF